MEQIVILVDEKDKFKGYTTWREGHFGRGRRHRGFVVLLFDESGNVYLQKRKHRVFDGLWDLTAISHPYRVEKGSKGSKGSGGIKSNKGSKGKDESLVEAALRALKNEMGIGKVELKDIGAFVYFARDGEWCENEYCHVLVGKFDGKYKPNKKLVYGAKKVKFEEFLEDIKKNSDAYTPWAKETAKMKLGEVMEQGGKELNEDLEKFKGEFEKYAKQYFEKSSKLTRKYPKLIQTFYTELEEFGQGGKLLRPYLVWTGYRIAKTDKGRSLRGLPQGPTLSLILPVCMAVELIHSFLLIHDDIIDRSDTRRGKPTMHKKFEKLNDAHYGGSMAILAGDLAWVEAFELISSAKLDLETKVQVLEKLQTIIKETIWGEALDVEYSYRKANIDQIWQVIDLKTAKYSFVGPLVLGYRLGRSKGDLGSRGSRVDSLQEFGMLVGRAYQLKDDMLAIFGDEKVTGKPGLSDMREGKNTVLLYKALEMSGQTQRQFISRYWGDEKAGVKELLQVRNIFEKSGALAWGEKKLEKMVGDAKKSAGLITKDKKLQQILEQLAQMVAARES